MSSSMRRRSGLMGFSLIGGSCLEGGVFDPSILKTERPHRHLRSINMVSASTAQPTAAPRSPGTRGKWVSAVPRAMGISARCRRTWPVLT
jgi:hypothetical protein